MKKTAVILVVAGVLGAFLLCAHSQAAIPRSKVRTIVLARSLHDRFLARRQRLEAAWERVKAHFLAVCDRKPSDIGRQRCRENAERIRLRRLAQWQRYTQIRNRILARRGEPLLSTTPPASLLSPIW